MGLVAEHSGLSTSQDAATLYMGRAASEWLPTLAEYTSQQGAVGLRVLGEGTIWVEDRTGLAVSRNMQNFLRQNIELEVANAREAMPELRSEEHTSELQSLMRISYAVFCLKKKKQAQPA